MTERIASVVVTINPHISQEGMRLLAHQVLERLWPGNAGGIHVIHGAKLLRMAQMLGSFAAEHGVRVRFRVIRDGISYRCEKIDEPVRMTPMGRG